MNKKIIFIGSILVLIALCGCIFSSGCVLMPDPNLELQEEYRLYGYDNPIISVYFDTDSQNGYQIIILDGVNCTILFNYQLTSVGKYVGVPYGFYVDGEYSEALGNLQNFTFILASNDTIRAQYKKELITLHTPY